MQKVLEAWWIRVNDVSHRALSWHVSFTKAAANLATICLDRLFGNRMLSLQAVGVSGCLSVISLHFITMFLFYRSDPIVTSVLTGEIEAKLYFTQNPSLFNIIQALFIGEATTFKMFFSPVESLFTSIISFLAIGAVVAAVTTRRFRHLPIALFSLSMVSVTVIFLFSSMYRGLIYSIIIWAIFLGVIFDIVAVVLTRQMIKLQATWTSFGRLFAAAVAELLLSLVLLVGPLFAGFVILLIGGDIGSTVNRIGIEAAIDYWWQLNRIRQGIVLSATTNVISAVLALSLFVALILLIIHRVIWPVMDRQSRSSLFRQHPAFFKWFAAPTLIPHP